MDPLHTGERLAPFVAWLATRIEDESTRRTYRQIAEHFLQFCDADRGEPDTRRQRFVHAHRNRVPPVTTRAALERLAEHDAVVRRTLPVES